MQKWMTKPMFLYMGLLFCVICWGSNFIFGTILVNYFQPMEIAFLRLIFINLFLFVFLFKSVRNFKSIKTVILSFMLIGFIGVTLNHWTFYASLTKADPVTAALILATAPICTSLMNFFVFKEEKSFAFWVWSLLSFIGVILVILKKGKISFGEGEAYIFLTMLTFSIFMIMIERNANKFSTSVITFYSSFFGMIFMAGLLPFAEVNLIRTAPSDIWILLIATAIIMHGICPVIWNYCITKVGSTNTSLLLNLEPFIAMVVGYIVLKESVSVLQFMGSLLILVSVTMAVQSNKRYVLRGRLNKNMSV